LSFALRLKARSLCSVKGRLSIPRRTSGPGVRDTRRVGGVTTAGNRRLGGSGARYDRPPARVLYEAARLQGCSVTRDGRDAPGSLGGGGWIQSVWDER
jgi:hypothetical protein